MAHTVRDWMSTPAVLIPPEVSVAQALTLMRRRRIHSLVVDLTEGEDKAFGIITTTDIRDKIVGEDRDPAEVTVGDIMTSPIYCALPDWSLKEAARKMKDLRIHHLPVQNSSGSVIGMISATDIFFAVEESGWESGL